MVACAGACGCGSDEELGPRAIEYAPHQVLDVPADGDLADPHVIEVDGTWYLYATNSLVDFEVWTSTDLARWESGGTVWAPTPGTWNAQMDVAGAWAPHVERAPDGYYLYYTANTRIGVARADSPLGPFEEIYDHPLVGNGHGGVGDGVLGEPDADLEERAIDAFVLARQDGSLTLYFSVNEPLATLYAIPMRDHSTLEDVEPTRLFGPEAVWESVVCEAPFVTEHAGELHLTYSANLAPTVDYAVGGAVGSAPLGPFTRYAENPILSKDPSLDFFGPGHHSIVRGAHDDLLIFYHTKTSPQAGYDRRVRYAPIRFESGRLQVDPPRP
jgi:beta-xylosidase